MIIHMNPDDYTTDYQGTTCEFHKQHPGELYAGCSCTSSWSLRMKTSEERRGRTRRIGDVPIPCVHPEHDPPMHMVFRPGRYEHTCPCCGRTVRFSIPHAYYA